MDETLRTLIADDYNLDDNIVIVDKEGSSLEYKVTYQRRGLIILTITDE